MAESQQLSTLRGHIFACTKSSEKECLDRMVFGTNKIYAEKINKVKDEIKKMEKEIPFGTVSISFLGKIKRDLEKN